MGFSKVGGDNGVGGFRMKEYSCKEGLDQELTKYHVWCILSLLCIDMIGLCFAI
jgi:hypothetical protein